MREFNPFTKLFETNNNPLARTYRTTLKQKCIDTFWILLGDPEMQFGLFDYLTLGIPLLFWIISTPLFNGPRSRIWRFVLIIFPNMIINVIPRFIFAALGILIVVPIILVIHLCSSLMAMKIKEKAFLIKIEQNDNNKSKSTQIISLIEKLKNDGSQSMENYYAKITPTQNNVFKYSLILCNHMDYPPRSRAAIIHIKTPLYANYVRQLAKLNFAGIGYQLENNTEFSNYVDTIHKGSIPWNHEAAINGYTCLMLLKLETKASRKSLPLALLFQIATFLVPENLDIANEMGLMKTKTKAPFFLMRKARGILDEMQPPKTNARSI